MGGGVVEIVGRDRGRDGGWRWWVEMVVVVPVVVVVDG